MPESETCTTPSPFMVRLHVSSQYKYVASLHGQSSVPYTADVIRVNTKQVLP